MTSPDAAALAIIGRHDRRLLAALLRVLTGHSTDEDALSLPPRLPDESVVAWACRARRPKNDAAALRGEVARVEGDAAAQVARAARTGAEPIPLGDARYPALVAAIPDPPPLLWVRGRTAALAAPAIALVGSRTATPYGLALAARLSRDLTAAGLVIVSGLARGVDSAAHAAALDAGGATIGVLGCGIDRIYPAEHGALARCMADAGAVVSEHPPGVPPLPHHFPLRNRIISGLSGAVVVVEAPEKSGALITAATALEQGREVMAVPGPVTGGRNRGAHLLIRDGAAVVETADDILRHLGLAIFGHALGTPAPDGGADLPPGPDFTVDDVAAHCGQPAAVVLARLLDLELGGHVTRIDGGRFLRVDSTAEAGPTGRGEAKMAIIQPFEASAPSLRPQVPKTRVTVNRLESPKP